MSNTPPVPTSFRHCLLSTRPRPGGSRQGQGQGQGKRTHRSIASTPRSMRALASSRHVVRKAVMMESATSIMIDWERDWRASFARRAVPCRAVPCHRRGRQHPRHGTYTGGGRADGTAGENTKKHKHIHDDEDRPSGTAHGMYRTRLYLLQRCTQDEAGRQAGRRAELKERRRGPTQRALPKLSTKGKDNQQQKPAANASGHTWAGLSRCSGLSHHRVPSSPVIPPTQSPQGDT